MTYSDQVRIHIAEAANADALANHARVSARNAFDAGNLPTCRLWTSKAAEYARQADQHRADAARANWRQRQTDVAA